MNIPNNDEILTILTIFYYTENLVRTVDLRIFIRSETCEKCTFSQSFNYRKYFLHSCIRENKECHDYSPGLKILQVSENESSPGFFI